MKEVCCVAALTITRQPTSILRSTVAGLFAFYKMVQQFNAQLRPFSSVSFQLLIGFVRDAADYAGDHAPVLRVANEP